VSIIYSLIPIVIPIIIPIVLAVLLVRGSLLLVMYKRLMQIPLRPTQYQLETFETLPSYYQNVFREIVEPMNALGFELVGAPVVRKMMVLDLMVDDRVLWFHHAETSTYGEVDLRFPIEGYDPWNISWITPLSDGYWLLTLHGQQHGVLGAFPNTILQDSYSADLASHWDCHRDRLKRLPEPESLSVADFGARLEQFYADYFVSLTQKRTIKPEGEGYAIRPLAGIQTTWHLSQGNGKVAKRRTARQRLLVANPSLQIIEVPLELQALSFHRMRAIERGGRTLKWGKWLLLGSFGLFLAIAYAVPQTSGYVTSAGKPWVVNLLLVLLIHELGHFLAMKAFGYQDVTMFFLPMFGAAVSGRKADASLSQKVWMLLAGPVPGMLVGLVLLVGQIWIPGLKSWDNLAWMLVSLNLANLLPILPLDGGKIAHLLLFSRYPLLDVGFRGVTVFCLSLLGLTSPLLLGLAVGIAIGIPNSYRTAQINLTLQSYLKQTPGLDLDDVLITALRQMRSAGYDKLPFNKRDAMAKELLDRYHEGKTGLVKRWLLGGLYAVSLLGGVAGTIAAVMPKLSPMLAASGSRRTALSDRAATQDRIAEQIDRSTQAIQADPRQASGYLRRASLYKSLAWQAGRSAQSDDGMDQDRHLVTPAGRSDLHKALADYGQAIRLDPQSSTYRARATLHRQLQNHSAEIADYSSILKLNPKDGKIRCDRAQAYTLHGQFTQARLDLDALIAQDNQRGDYYLLRANLRQQMKDYRGAVSDAGAAIAIDDQNAAAYEARSYARKALGDSVQARADFQKAQALR
jgi:tetratricopeptide (TPR) repeat protein/Zn-dependent protease